MESISKDQGILSRIELSNGKAFEVVHNMDAFGLSLQDAIDAWTARNQVAWRKPKWTAESFCRYVMRKQELVPDLFCVTKKRFYEVCAEQGFNPTSI